MDDHDAEGPDGVPGWAAPFREFKESCLNGPHQGMMPPIVMAFRRDILEAVVWAPQVDRDLGLKGAYFLRIALDPDRIIMAVDTFAHPVESMAEYESMTERWPDGRMQSAVASGDRGKILDAIMVLSIDRTGSIVTHTATYAAGPGEFRWTEFWAGTTPRGTAGGEVPAALRRIMACAPTSAETPQLPERARRKAREEPERFRYINASAAFMLLMNQGYYVHDNITGSGPDYEPTLDYARFMVDRERAEAR